MEANTKKNLPWSVNQKLKDLDRGEDNKNNNFFNIVNLQFINKSTDTIILYIFLLFFFIIQIIFNNL